MCRLKINHVSGIQNMRLFLAQRSTWSRTITTVQRIFRDLRRKGNTPSNECMKIPCCQAGANSLSPAVGQTLLLSDFLVSFYKDDVSVFLQDLSIFWVIAIAVSPAPFTNSFCPHPPPPPPSYFAPFFSGRSPGGPGHSGPGCWGSGSSLPAAAASRPPSVPYVTIIARHFFPNKHHT